ncbi:flagellar motor protein MotD [Ectothiorhodospira shaposhnikovii]|uniref:flagellar motor protein MotD n=1 Tax=Ectothiorhodospira shaposhnikovii TaxID=1054 RepID=UPI00190733AE|nr:flagellar motor protein MotD [Ectothiorhodospira shaposhnikovii]MBK1674024.1 flagellar motor protein MotD [Ectothiorhodospira shaposhnikovii]
MSRRRKKHEEHINHEAWAIPYADLLTLLLAFFVVMYAISSLNEGKYRILSESLVEAFRATPRTIEPIQVGDLTRSPRPSVVEPPPITAPVELGQMTRSLEEILVDMDLEGLSVAIDGINAMADEIEVAMAPLIEAGLIEVGRDRLWIEVQINTSILFASGSADLAADAIPILERLAGILAQFPARIQVEGHTDNVPISTAVYPSNWELSSGRAATVVNLFARNGVDPEQMAAIGFGEYRPKADNTTPEGRLKNRRVNIVVLAGRRPGMTQGTPPEMMREDIEMLLKQGRQTVEGPP